MGGLTSLLLLLCVGFTVSAVLDLQKRIIGGHDCLDNERRYHVRLVKTDGTHVSICGGSLLNQHWILTVAHCWRDGWTMTAEAGVHPNGGRPVPITRHEIFRDDQNRTHDIMLLKLPNPTKINHFIPLPNCGPGQQPAVGTDVQVAGFGPTNEKADTRPRKLQCANLAKVNCPAQQTYEHVFCGSTAGVSTCGGDSGGGVVFNGMIYGVHESIFNSTCPVISEFMDVCSYLGWIRGITNIP